MTSLYNRASPPQQRILRIIEGAVKNVHDAHGLELNPRHARSIAKRATGTLTACWPEVLGAKEPSKKAERAKRSCSGPLAGDTSRAPQAQLVKPARKGKQSLCGNASPLRYAKREIWRKMRDIKATGDQSRIEAFIEILRLIDAVEKKFDHASSNGRTAHFECANRGSNP